jgi:hypothetical protein
MSIASLIDTVLDRSILVESGNDELRLRRRPPSVR